MKRGNRKRRGRASADSRRARRAVARRDRGRPAPTSRIRQPHPLIRRDGTVDPRPAAGWIDGFAADCAQPDLARAVLDAVWLDAGSTDLIGGAFVEGALDRLRTRVFDDRFGPAQTLDLLDRFVDSLERERRLEPWDRDCHRFRIDRMRALAGVPTRGRPVAWEVLRVPSEVQALAEAFSERAFDRLGIVPERSTGVVRHLSSSVTRSGLVRFGALDPDELAADMEAAWTGTPSLWLRGAMILRVAAELCLHLDEQRELEPTRAHELAGRSLRQALRFATTSRTA